jgi:hypothetical protein
MLAEMPPQNKENKSELISTKYKNCKMKKVIIIILKIFLLTFVGNISMKFIVPALGISNPIISATLTPISIGILIYFLFFKKSKPENNL